ALTAFQTAYRLKGNDPARSPQYLQNIGIAYFRLGKRTEAKQIYDQLQPRDAKLASALLGLIAGTENATDPKPAFAKPAASGAAARLLQAKEALDAAVDDDDFKKVIELSKKALAANPRST